MDDFGHELDPLPQLQQLMLRYLQAAPASRHLVLEGICAQHPDLAAGLRQRIGLLQEVGFIGETTPPAALAIPTTLGDFRLIHRLGQGAMGVLFLAEQTGLGRRVALKLMRPETPGSELAQRRFQHEGRALSRVDHPAVCPVYEVGRFAELDGAPYLAMRHIDGSDLSTLLDAGRARGDLVLGLPGTSRTAISARRLQVIAMIASCARGAHAAHEQGLVHRDLKQPTS